MRRMTFANLFKLVWLSKRWLDLHICFYIQPVAISHIIQPLENSTVQS